MFYAGIQPRALRGAGTAVYAFGIAERELSNVLVAAPLPGELRTLCGGVFFGTCAGNKEQKNR